MDKLGNDRADERAKSAAKTLLPPSDVVERYLERIRNTVLAQAWMVKRSMSQVEVAKQLSSDDSHDDDMPLADMDLWPDPAQPARGPRASVATGSANLGNDRFKFQLSSGTPRACGEGAEVQNYFKACSSRRGRRK